MPPQNDPAASAGNTGNGENPAATGPIEPNPAGQGVSPPTPTEAPIPAPQPTADPQPTVAPPIPQPQPVASEAGAAIPEATASATAGNPEVTNVQAPPQPAPQPNPEAPADNTGQNTQPVAGISPDPGIPPAGQSPEHATAIHAGGVDTLPASADFGKKKKLLLLGIAGVVILGIAIAAIIFIP